MRHFLALFIVAGVGLLAVGSGARAEDAADKTRDPNEKVCEVYTPIGSRLGSKKVCGTRAEWAEKRRLDKESLDRAQVGACMTQTTGNTGKSSC